MTRSLPFWSRTGTTSTTPAVVRLPPDWTELIVQADALSYATLGQTYTAPSILSVNGIYTISSLGTPTDGTFVAQVLDRANVLATTTALTYDESAADVKSALVATGYFATGDITAAGGALPTAITLTLTGVYATTVPALNIVSSVTGGVISGRVSTRPLGNGGYSYIEANSEDTWRSDGHNAHPAFLYIATVASTGNYRVSAFR